ncbi:HEAT repeat domain-containing protein [Halomicrobium urmianum]|uniref:HEAT repeat domain-containing protein n=1 Tax=Halomicrobium urmianum TaxID=1586233 RepID=UPI001CD94BD4|nr:HEAT repeat domain-containing protein [Halomicrobium urmianum]
MSHENWSALGRAPAETEDGLREVLSGDAARTRREAALALVDGAEESLDDATVAALTERVRGDDDADVRQFAVEALGVAGTGREAIETALDDPEPWVRAEAVVALSRAGGDADRLREALGDDSGWVRRNAVIALGKLDAADQDLLVERVKSDPHPAVREYAAQFLGRDPTDREEAERILAALLAREANAFARAKAAEGLGRIGTDRAEEALETHGLTDRSEDVARTARHALADARGVEPDRLDADVDPPTAPGSGPDTPGDQAVEGFRPDPSDPTGWSEESTAPGGAPGFDPRRDLDSDMTDR